MYYLTLVFIYLLDQTAICLNVEALFYPPCSFPYALYNADSGEAHYMRKETKQIVWACGFMLPFLSLNSKLTQFFYNMVLCHVLFFLSGEGNGNPLPYSCLKNSTDRGAWRAEVHGVAKSWTGLSDWAHSFLD